MDAEEIPRAEVGEGDLPAAPAARRDAHQAGDDEVHVAVAAAAPDDVLVAGVARPAALRGDFAQVVGVQALEQVDLLQAEQRRYPRGGTPGRGGAAGGGHAGDYNSCRMDTLTR